ncbi:aldehyde dehydrogenase [mine drainage metagenome]|uniref:Aldehyde dehydrogenase n=1 Tax=mine drainage metagenome TaxID=410659 RepID=T1B9S4_9ZZZZ
MPVVTYDTLGEAFAHIQAGSAPLAIYYFGNDRKRLDEVLRVTRSGGVVVNDTLLHFVQNGLPFGGVGESGMGQYHGIHGFLTFSKARGVFQQSRWSGFTLLLPPYGARARRLLDFLVRR